MTASNDYFGRKLSIYETIGKSVQPIAADTLTEQLPSLGVLFDSHKITATLQSQLGSKTGRLRLVIGVSIAQLGLRFLHEADGHGFRCLASTSFASRAVVSPSR